MKRWFISDTHFGHENIIRYSQRPFKNVDHMNQMLVHNWNDRVHPRDTVFHLGDVALGPWEKWDRILRSLHGTKVLVVGNHDRIFERMQPKVQARFAPLYADWFRGGVHRRHGGLVIGKTRVNLSHFDYDQDRYERTFPRIPDEGVPLIHGHTHSKQQVTRSEKGTLQIHVGVDAWDYAPVSEEQVAALLEAS